MTKEKLTLQRIKEDVKAARKRAYRYLFAVAVLFAACGFIFFQVMRLDGVFVIYQVVFGVFFFLSVLLLFSTIIKVVQLSR